jgi:DNA end-binding protein Ku
VPERDAADGDALSSRPFWSGTLTFGLVSIPVSLHPAVRSRGVSLRMVDPKGRPLSRRYVSSRDGKPLDWDRIARGYEIEKEEFVVVDDDELERIAPEKTRDIDLTRFVDASGIDPIYFDRPYVLTPAGSSTKAYRLLARVMEDTGRAGVATFVMRAKEYLIAILAENGVLHAETLRFADEIRSPEDVGLPEPVKPPAPEVKRIEREIARLQKQSLELDELADRSSERLERIARERAGSGAGLVKGKEEPRESSGDIIDLVEMLQRSLRGRGADGGNGDEPSDPEDAAASGDDDLGQRTRAELYERAKELDIAGRSAMSKDELVEAIRRGA